jgi:hypothetical protein
MAVLRGVLEVGLVLEALVRLLEKPGLLGVEN